MFTYILIFGLFTKNNKTVCAIMWSSEGYQHQIPNLEVARSNRAGVTSLFNGLLDFQSCHEQVGVKTTMDSAEANERTTDVGLYHYARSYRKAANALLNANIKSTHPDGPIDLLYVHAIELYLKAFLRHHKYSVSDLFGFGHDYKKLGKEFEFNGGVLDDEDKDVLRLIDENNMLSRSRYIVTGARTKVAHEALVRTTKSLHATVRETLKTAGRSVR